MKKQCLIRGGLGFPIGVMISQLITICISLFFAKGKYLAVVPALVDVAGSELNAVIWQTLLSGILGSAFAMISLIWEMERWSIAKQTGIYFLLACFVMMPIAYLTHWMEHSLQGFIKHFLIFLLLFVVVWGIQYVVWRTKVEEINKKLTS